MQLTFSDLEIGEYFSIPVLIGITFQKINDTHAKYADMPGAIVFVWPLTEVKVEDIDNR